MSTPKPPLGFYNITPGRLTPKEIRQKYQIIANLLNELERNGEELTLFHDEFRLEVRGQTGHAWRLPDFKATWRSE